MPSLLQQKKQKSNPLFFSKGEKVKVIGSPKGFRIGRKGFFWYDFFHYCYKCEAMISKDRKFEVNGRGGLLCPFCESKLRTRPARSKSRDKYRKAHTKRIQPLFLLIRFKRKGDCLSIKKTPICPFCKSEMKKISTGIASEGAVIITERKYDEEMRDDRIKGTFTLQMYHCKTCRFVALWWGDP